MAWVVDTCLLIDVAEAESSFGVDSAILIDAKRPVADMLIGAFASRFDGLLTRNESDFRPVSPTLKILNP